MPGKHSMSKRLTRQRVIAIRKQYDVGHGIQEIADGHEFSRTTVSQVVHMKSHQRVKDVPYPPFPGTDEDEEEPARSSTGG